MVEGFVYCGKARTFGIIAVIAIFIYVSSQLGVPLFGVIAGLGVGAIAIALAAQPTLENFIGGLNLFVDRPVRVGDFCLYGEDPTLDWQRIGIVESIGFCSAQIYIAVNGFGLALRDNGRSAAVVLATLRDMLLAHPRVSDDELRVRFAGFGDPELTQIVEGLESYYKQDKRQYAHFVDGGITDNLGLRAPYEIITVSGGMKSYMKKSGRKIPGHVMMISIDASTTPEPEMDASRKQPSLSETIGAMSDVQLHRYNTDTLGLMNKSLTRWASELAASGKQGRHQGCQAARGVSLSQYDPDQLLTQR